MLGRTAILVATSGAIFGCLSAALYCRSIFARAEVEGLSMNHPSVLNDLLARWIIGIAFGVIAMSVGISAASIIRRFRRPLSGRDEC
jgi:membrane associated rhomboid family serine protease